jgi:hypothetical protein
VCVRGRAWMLYSVFLKQHQTFTKYLGWSTIDNNPRRSSVLHLYMASMCATVNEPCSPLTKVSKNFFEVFGDLLSLFVKQLGFLADWEIWFYAKYPIFTWIEIIHHQNLSLPLPRSISTRRTSRVIKPLSRLCVSFWLCA